MHESSGASVLKRPTDGIIEIRNLRVWATHGVLDEEKISPQEFLISVKATLDLSEAIFGDDVSRTFDYAKASAVIERVALTNSFNLIERLAMEIALALLRANPILQISVKVKKLRPQMSSSVKYASVKLILDRSWIQD